MASSRTRPSAECCGVLADAESRDIAHTGTGCERGGLDDGNGRNESGGNFGGECGASPDDHG